MYTLPAGPSSLPPFAHMPAGPCPPACCCCCAAGLLLAELTSPPFSLPFSALVQALQACIASQAPGTTQLNNSASLHDMLVRQLAATAQHSSSSALEALCVASLEGVKHADMVPVMPGVEEGQKNLEACESQPFADAGLLAGWLCGAARAAIRVRGAALGHGVGTCKSSSSGNTQRASEQAYREWLACQVREQEVL